jgi:hypothetical protein
MQKVDVILTQMQGHRDALDEWMERTSAKGVPLP